MSEELGHPPAKRDSCPETRRQPGERQTGPCPLPPAPRAAGGGGVGRSGPSGSIWHCLERTLTCSRGWASGQTGGEHPTVCGTAPGTRGPHAFLIPAPGASAGAAGTHDNIWGHSWPSRLGRGVMRAPPGPPREQARGSQCQASHAEEDEELQKGMTPAPSFISGEDAPKSKTTPPSHLQASHERGSGHGSQPHAACPPAAPRKHALPAGAGAGGM